jgi:hypothetical protein
MYHVGNAFQAVLLYPYPATIAWSTLLFMNSDLRAFIMGIEFLANPVGEQMNTIIESISAK